MYLKKLLTMAFSDYNYRTFSTIDGHPISKSAKMAMELENKGLNTFILPLSLSLYFYIPLF